MKSLFTLFFLTIVTACLAQQVPNAYFLKKDGSYVSTKDSADYVRVISQPVKDGDLYTVTDYYKSGPRKLVGQASVDFPPKFEGVVISSFENGRRKAVNNYKNGILVGDQYEFFPNGKPYTVKNYASAVPAPFQEFLITANYDSLGTALVTDRNGYYKGYDASFEKIIEQGPIKNGKKDGEWKFSDSIANRVHIYADGKFISGISTNKKGEVKKYTTAETLPMFPGGPQAFSNYLGRNIRYPQGDRLNSVQGKVVVTFTVEKDGKLSDVEVIRGVSPTIDEEAIRVVQNSPAWIPGIQFGEVVRAKYTIPISFSLGYPH
jgi:TonB family protein